MIDHEQLAEALRRMDPRDLELLDLSLHRRVPDASLGEVFGCGAQDVARRRAAAIDRLADDLGVVRGEDLGRVLTALLEPKTWHAVGPAGAQAAAPARPEPPAPKPVTEPKTAPPPAETQTGTAVADAPGNGAGASEPAFDLLGRREKEKARSPRTASWILAGVLGAAALIAAAGFAGATIFGKDESSSVRQHGSEERHFAPKGIGPVAAPFASDPRSACYPTAYIRRPVTLYRKPRGRKELRIAARTEWRSPRVLSVVNQKGSWLAVQAAELENGQVGWMKRARARVGCVHWSLKVDLSKRALFVRENGRTVRRMTVAVGAPGHATPKGRFAVTDRLKVVDQRSVYGCCVLALTGHQRKLPPGWPGGDRLAIHATGDTETIGKAVSLGCMRTTSSQARWLIQNVPLGTPVFIRA